MTIADIKVFDKAEKMHDFIMKGGPAASAKIDPVAALIDALYCFDLSEGRVEK